MKQVVHVNKQLDLVGDVGKWLFPHEFMCYSVGFSFRWSSLSGLTL
uniref:Uncharacterized protein n=1 Tax=Arundo donax TaxID=35708 RepID=A0A0A9C021_ARUDO